MARETGPSSNQSSSSTARTLAPAARNTGRPPLRHDESSTTETSMAADKNPLRQAVPDAIAWNFRLLAHHELGGFGGMGEGMAVQIAKDGRRIMWLAHESAPKNFTGPDVSDPRKPKVVAQTELPQNFMRSNSLEVTGDVMAVAYQT